MDERQLKEDYKMFSDLWKFYKAYCEVREEDSFWEEVTNKADRIYKRYETKLCKDMVLNIVDELERKYVELKNSPHQTAI